MHKEVKKPLQSYSSSKSLKKCSSKTTLKRQNSSPYLTLDSNNSKIIKNKSPKKKNKSVEIMKFKNVSQSTIGGRKKLGASF